MKYYSEKTEQLYPNIQALKKAEAEFDNAKEEELRVETEAEKMKEDLYANYQNISQKLDEAYEELEVAKQKAEELSKKYLEEVDAIMKPATDKVEKLKVAKTKAWIDYKKHISRPVKTLIDELFSLPSFLD